MLYKHKVTILPVLLMVAVVAASLSINASKAATVGVLDIISSSQNVSVAASHDIKFYAVSPSAVNTAKTLTLTFSSTPGAGFSAVSTVAAADITTFTINGVAQAVQAAADTTHWGVSASGQVVTFTGPSSGTSIGGIANNDLVHIVIASHIVNPDAVGTGTVALAGSGSFVDTGTANIPIIAPASVTITATVDPTISFAVNTALCNLGSLPLAPDTSTPATITDAHGSCAYTITHATNAQNGISISAAAAGPLTNGTHPITALADSAVDGLTTAGAPVVEEYGFQVALGGADTAASTYATQDMPILTGPTLIISNAGAHLSATDTVTHKAAVTSITPAGSYSQTVTWTAVGNF